MLDYDLHCDWIDAICARPADDTVRLAYADALERGGQLLRAEYIRASFVPDLRRVANEILRCEGVSWLRGAYAADGDCVRDACVTLDSDAGRVNCTYQRGFVQAIRLSFSAWMSSLHTVVHGARYPALRSPLKQPVEVVVINEGEPELRASLRRLGFPVPGPADTQRYAKILLNDHWPHLRFLFGAQ